jgi:hypothetical protein
VQVVLEILLLVHLGKMEQAGLTPFLVLLHLQAVVAVVVTLTQVLLAVQAVEVVLTEELTSLAQEHRDKDLLGVQGQILAAQFMAVEVEALEA